jgi:hypothetical protein
VDLLASLGGFFNQKVCVGPRLEFWSPFCTGILDSLVFRLKHFLTDYVSGECHCTCHAVIVMYVA